MSLFNLNVERSVESLKLRDKFIEELEREMGVRMGFCYNDLYKNKRGVVRRLKGYISNGKNLSDKEFNDLLDDVSDFILNLNWNRFRVDLVKIKNYSFNCYKLSKEKGFEGSWEDFKKDYLNSERRIILKISWDC